MSDIISSLQRCSNIIDDITKKNEQAFLIVSELSKQLEAFETMLNNKTTPRVFFEKTMFQSSNEIISLSVSPLPENNSHVRIFAEIININQPEKNKKAPARQLKVAYRIKIAPFFEEFLNDYRDHVIQYLQNLSKV